jgi:hypothetical protein
MESQPSPAPPDPTPVATKKLPRWALVAILIGGGVVLAVGGCGFFLAQMNSSQGETQAMIGGVAFVAGLVMLAVGGLTALVFGAQWLFKKRDGN